MNDKRILLDRFEIPRLPGLEYLLDKEKPRTDYLFVNDPHERFSMYFEKDFPKFRVPDRSEREYCLFDINRQGRKISFFCPEKKKNLDSAVWYFCVELLDGSGEIHELSGQVRVGFDAPCIRAMKSKPRFIEILEQVRLNKEAITA